MGSKAFIGGGNTTGNQSQPEQGLNKQPQSLKLKLRLSKHFKNKTLAVIYWCSTTESIVD